MPVSIKANELQKDRDNKLTEVLDYNLEYHIKCSITTALSDT